MNCLVQLRPFRLPLRAAVRTAHGVLTERAGVALRLEDTATGRAAHGEAAPLPAFGGGTADDALAALGSLGTRATAAQLAAVAARGGCVAFAVESALAALGTERVGSHAAVGAAGSLPVAALLPAGRAALARIGALAEAGFRTFKWKVGVAPPAEELPLLDDLCAALPPGARLRLDANGAWDRRAAERWLERCAERPVEFVEQPCLAAPGAGAAGQARAEDLLRGLADGFPTPLALDESLAGPGDVERWLAAGWRGVWVVKPALFGGAALARLRAAGAEVVFSSALETAVGAQAALRLAFAWHAPGLPPVSAPAGERGQDDRAAPRALGFGVWPLFADVRLDGPLAAPFLRARDVESLNVEAVWNALP